VLRADLAQLSDSLKALDKQIAQKLATRKRLNMSIASPHILMDTLNQRVAMRQQAIDLKVGTKINLYDAKEELEKSQVELATDEGQLIETEAALKELQSEKAKTISQFIADNQNKLAEALRKADEARQALVKATGLRVRNSMRRSTASFSRRLSPPSGRSSRLGSSSPLSHRLEASFRSRRSSLTSTPASSNLASQP